MGLVSAVQLKKYMSGIHMSTSQTESADTILDGVQSELEMYINRAIEARLIREVVTSDCDGYVYLRQSPIAYINRITIPTDATQTNYIPGSGVDLEDLDESLAESTQDLVPAKLGRGLVVAGGLQTGFASTSLIVEYGGGGSDFFVPYYDAIILGILRVAAREFQTMHDDTMSMRTTGNAETPTDPIPLPAKGWQPEELRRFDRIRRRVIR